MGNSMVRILDKIKKQCPKFEYDDLQSKISLTEEEEQLIVEFLIGCIEDKKKLKDKKFDAVKFLNELNNSTHNLGKIYEILVYSFLYHIGAPFKIQVQIGKKECLKVSSNYDADGIFDGEDVVFEVKKYNMETNCYLQIIGKKQLTMLMPKYKINVCGKLDISTEIINGILNNKKEIKEKILKTKEINYKHQYIDGNRISCYIGRTCSQNANIFKSYGLHKMGKREQIYIFF